MRSLSIAWCAGLLAFCLAVAAGAQNYPSKPIRLVSPFPPGSPSDTLGRLIGQPLTEVLGQPLVIDNRTGAGGVIGVNMAAKATPDGYTLLIASTGPLSIRPAFMAKAPYDTVKDFAPISLVVNSPFIFAVGSSVAASTFKEFVALAKSKPRAFNYASTGLTAVSAAAVAAGPASNLRPLRLAEMVAYMESTCHGEVTAIQFDASGDKPAHYHVDMRFPRTRFARLDVDAVTRKISAHEAGSLAPGSATLAEVTTLVTTKLPGQLMIAELDAGEGVAPHYDVDVRIGGGIARLKVDAATRSIGWRQPAIIEE